MKRKIVCIIFVLLLGFVFGCQPAEEPAEHAAPEKHEATSVIYISMSRPSLDNSKTITGSSTWIYTF